MCLDRQAGKSKHICASLSLSVSKKEIEEFDSPGSFSDGHGRELQSLGYIF
jgi:hypothetical protein